MKIENNTLNHSSLAGNPALGRVTSAEEGTSPLGNITLKEQFSHGATYLGTVILLQVYNVKL